MENIMTDDKMRKAFDRTFRFLTGQLKTPIDSRERAIAWDCYLAATEEANRQQQATNDLTAGTKMRDIRDKWKMVDADCRDGADGLITYHVDAFDEGVEFATEEANRQAGAVKQQADHEYNGLASQCHALCDSLGIVPDHPCNRMFEAIGKVNILMDQAEIVQEPVGWLLHKGNVGRVIFHQEELAEEIEDGWTISKILYTTPPSTEALVAAACKQLARKIVMELEGLASERAMKQVYRSSENFVSANTQQALDDLLMKLAQAISSFYEDDQYIEESDLHNIIDKVKGTNHD